MMNKKKLLVLLPFMLSTAAHAAQTAPKTSVQAGVGMLNTEGGEFVYDGDHKLSQLDWKAKNAKIFQLGTNTDFGDQWTVNGNFWITMNDDSKGHMTDRDWENYDQAEYTDISTHDATKLKQAYQIDLSGTYWFYSENQIKAGVMGGLQHSHFDWSAGGGHYIYDNGTDVFDGDPNHIGITYEQTYTAAYVGLNSKMSIGRNDFGVAFKYSPYVHAKDHDHHINREVHFEETNNGDGKMYGVSLDYAFNFTKNAALYAQYSLTDYKESKADTTLTSAGTNTKQLFTDGAGLSSKSQAVTAGFRYTF